jgi:hypothetical protein
LNRCVRQNFEDVVDDLERKALGALAAIRRHHKTYGESRITDICARAGSMNTASKRRPRTLSR